MLSSTNIIFERDEVSHKKIRLSLLEALIKVKINFLDHLMLIDIIAGARPNFMKVAPIIHALQKRQASGSTLRYRLVHTGQHYDERMSDSFFSQLNIPAPDINLEAGSGSHAQQTAAILIRYENLLISAPSDICLVVGDVTSTLACALAAQKLRIPVAHVEAGIRSGDWGMPEEINRLATDAITNWFFTTSSYANENLIKSGVSSDRIFFVGNTMIDTLLRNLNHLRKPIFFDQLHLRDRGYFVCTLHRPSNVDSEPAFESLLQLIADSTKGLPVIFPAHPRTQRALQTIANLPSNIHLVDPQPYLEFNYLVKNAKAVITDSGGITEETTVMGVPCLTLRDTTERPETVSIGTNVLVDSISSSLPNLIENVLVGRWKKGSIPELWDGHAGERIVETLEQLQMRKN